MNNFDSLIDLALKEIEMEYASAIFIAAGRAQQTDLKDRDFRNEFIVLERAKELAVTTLKNLKEEK